MGGSARALATLKPRAAVLHLGLEGARGATRRTESWMELLAAAEVDALAISLLPGMRRRPPDTRGLLRTVAATVPETVAWSSRLAAAALIDFAPDAIVCVSARAYHPALTPLAGRVVLDFVDRLSVSYRDRSLVVRNLPRQAGFRLLSTAHARFERRLPPPPVVTTAAGYQDAVALRATWLPITARVPPLCAPRSPTHDLLFAGTLSYPPNIAALRRLGQIWPLMIHAHPSTTLLVAGARPVPEVFALAARHGWTLRTDFDSFEDLASEVRVAVAPLDHTAGIQIKVLDAAAVGLPQVVSPEAIKGFAPGFPAAVARNDHDFVREVHRLMSRPDEASALANRAQKVVMEQYSAEVWTPVVKQILFDSPPVAEQQ